MALPKLNTNLIYETKIPSTGRNIKFRPFLVGEEKLFLIAAQSNSIRVFYDTIKRVISQCIIEDNFDVEDLKGYDLDYIFLQLRSRSVGETENLVVLCGQCDAKNSYTIDFHENVYIINSDKPSETKIDLGSGIFLSLKIPDASKVLDIQESQMEDLEIALSVVDTVIDKVYMQDEMINFHDESYENRQTFIQSMTTDQLSLITDFLQKQPQIALDMKFNCQSCGKENERTLMGISDFF